MKSGERNRFNVKRVRTSAFRGGSIVGPIVELAKTNREKKLHETRHGHTHKSETDKSRAREDQTTA